MSLFRTKPLSVLLEQVSHNNLKRTLSASNLIALGIGAIIGAGLFVRTAAASAEAAGPAVTLSFLVGAVGCVFAGLCYSEFAAMIPIAGSAYTYAYTTMGEFVAWIIGWALVLEYALGAATVSDIAPPGLSRRQELALARLLARVARVRAPKNVRR